MKLLTTSLVAFATLIGQLCHAAPTGASVALTAALPTSPILKLLAGNNSATGSAVVNVLSSGTTYGNLFLNCSIAASNAEFAIVGGAQRNIAGGTALGPNDPPIALRCTPQATIVSATLSCEQRPTPDATLPALSVTAVCPPRPTALVEPTPTLDFGTLRVGLSTTQDVVLSNPSALVANVRTCEFIGENAADFAIAGVVSSYFPMTIQAGSSARLPVRFSANLPTGDKQALLECLPGQDTTINSRTALRAVAAPAPREAVNALSQFGLFVLVMGLLVVTTRFWR